MAHEESATETEDFIRQFLSADVDFSSFIIDHATPMACGLSQSDGAAVLRTAPAQAGRGLAPMAGGLSQSDGAAAAVLPKAGGRAVPIAPSASFSRPAFSSISTRLSIPAPRDLCAKVRITGSALAAHSLTLSSTPPCSPHSSFLDLGQRTLRVLLPWSPVQLQEQEGLPAPCGDPTLPG